MEVIWSFVQIKEPIYMEVSTLNLKVSILSSLQLILSSLTMKDIWLLLMELILRINRTSLFGVYNNKLSLNLIEPF